jgi:hypothetical protein
LSLRKAGGDHGRIEVRRHVISHKVDRLADDSRFPGIKTIAMVENRVERNGETSCERRYYIYSAVLLALLLANCSATIRVNVRDNLDEC